MHTLIQASRRSISPGRIRPLLALFIVPALVFVLAGPVHAQSGSPDPVDRLRELVTGERYAEAVEYADSVLENDPDNALVAFWRDRAQRRLTGEMNDRRVTNIERNAPPVRRQSTEELTPMATPAPTPAAAAMPGGEASPPGAAPTPAAVAPPTTTPPPPPTQSGSSFTVLGLSGIVLFIVAAVVLLVIVGVAVMFMRKRGTTAPAPAAAPVPATGLSPGLTTTPAAAPAAVAAMAREQAAVEEPEQEPEEDPQDNIHDAVTQAGQAQGAGSEAEEENQGEVSFNSLMFDAGDETVFGDDAGPAVQKSAATGDSPDEPNLESFVSEPPPKPEAPKSPPAPTPAPPPAAPPPPADDGIQLHDEGEPDEPSDLDLEGGDDSGDDEDDGGETIRL